MIAQFSAISCFHSCNCQYNKSDWNSKVGIIPALSSHTFLRIALLGVALVLTAVLFVYYALQVQIRGTGLAFDWQIIWGALQGGAEWGGSGGMYNPPWGVLFLLPFAALSLNVSLGFLMFLLMVVVLVSPPPGIGLRRWVLSVVLVAIAYPTLRSFASMNVEVFNILGVLLLIWAYRNRNPYVLALGILIGTIKPQTMLLLIPLLGIYLLLLRDWRFLFTTAAIVVTIVSLSMLWAGPAWLESMANSSLPTGISLQRVLARAQVPLLLIRVAQLLIIVVTVYLVWRRRPILDYPVVGLLLTASVLVSPYTNMHSMLLLLIFGVIPLIIRHPLIGLPIYFFYIVPPFLSRDLAWTMSYWTVTSTLTWIAVGWMVYTYTPQAADEFDSGRTQSMQELGVTQ